MTDFEIAELAITQQELFWQMWSLSESLTDKANVYIERIMTLLFGYLAVAYFVGAKLTRIQAAVFTILYLVWTLGLVMSLRETSGDVALVATQMQKLDPILNTSILRNNSVSEGNGVAYMLAGCIFASLYFMWSELKQDRSDDDSL